VFHGVAPHERGALSAFDSGIRGTPLRERREE